MVFGISKYVVNFPFRVKDSSELAGVVVGEIHEIQGHRKGYNYSPEFSKTVRKCLTTLDFIIGNPMRNIDMILCLLDLRLDMGNVHETIDCLDWGSVFDAYRIKSNYLEYSCFSTFSSPCVMEERDTFTHNSDVEVESDVKSSRVGFSTRFFQLFDRKASTKNRASFSAAATSFMSNVMSPRWIQEAIFYKSPSKVHPGAF